VIVFSDLHLREDSENIVFNEVLPGILEAALMDPDKRVAFLGDWWHIRYTVSVRLFNRVRDELNEWCRLGVKVFLLPGNHDQVDYEGRNALEALGDLDGVEVFTNPCVNEWGLWIPYRVRNEDIKDALSLWDSMNAQPIVWMHHGVNGSLMNDHKRNTEGVPTDTFRSFHKVFCGHYHKRQELGNVTYIGSPWQTKADEAGQPKGYGIWDANTMTMKFVDTQWGPRFHTIELQPGEKLDLSGVRPNDEVRVTTAPGVDASKIGKQLLKAGVAHVVTPQVEAEEARLDVDANASMKEYAQAYVNQIAPEGLNKERLMSAFEELTA